MIKLIRYAAIATIVILNLSLLDGCGPMKSIDDDVKILTMTLSPDKEIVATAYDVYGGGAAGYLYTFVNIRNKEVAFNQSRGIVFQGTSVKDISLEWQDNDLLIIKYSKLSNVYTQEKEWRDKRKILINYITK